MYTYSNINIFYINIKKISDQVILFTRYYSMGKHDFYKDTSRRIFIITSVITEKEWKQPKY